MCWKPLSNILGAVIDLWLGYSTLKIHTRLYANLNRYLQGPSSSLSLLYHAGSREHTPVVGEAVYTAAAVHLMNSIGWSNRLPSMTDCASTQKL